MCYFIQQGLLIFKQLFLPLGAAAQHFHRIQKLPAIPSKWPEPVFRCSAKASFPPALVNHASFCSAGLSCAGLHCCLCGLQKEQDWCLQIISSRNGDKGSHGFACLAFRCSQDPPKNYGIMRRPWFFCPPQPFGLDGSFPKFECVCFLRPLLELLQYLHSCNRGCRRFL